jgi:hypothetical protein
VWAARSSSTVTIALESIANRAPAANASRSLIDMTSWAYEFDASRATTIVPARGRDETRLSSRSLRSASRTV